MLKILKPIIILTIGSDINRLTLYFDLDQRKKKQSISFVEVEVLSTAVDANIVFDNKRTNSRKIIIR